MVRVLRNGGLEGAHTNVTKLYMRKPFADMLNVEKLETITFKS